MEISGFGEVAIAMRECECDKNEEAGIGVYGSGVLDEEVAVLVRTVDGVGDEIVGL